MTAKLPPFGEIRPELLTEWVAEKNDVPADRVSGGSAYMANWRCKICGCEWVARVANRCRKGHGCPKCTGQQIDAEDSIATTHTDLMREWHPTKNAEHDPTTISAGSKKRVWWQCQTCDYEWDSFVFNRTGNRNNCPRCSGQFASSHNSLANLYPEIAAELHPTKNGTTKARDLTGKSGRKVWWLCPDCMNEYETVVRNRTHKNSGCPLCASDRVGRQTAERIAAEEDDSLVNYSYDADEQLLLQHREIQDAFRNYLSIEPDPRSIDGLLSPRVRTRIDYTPYYQRNYVWDTAKATYFIESILLGTEIPPLIFFETGDGFEVIDGRQRFETLLRFYENKFVLTRKGLHALKSQADLGFKELSEEFQSVFLDTTIRIVKFRLVDAKRCGDHIQDLIKKEVFRRYNSGITPLRRLDVNRAVYIKDSITSHFKRQLKRNASVFESVVRCFLAESDRAKMEQSDTIEKALQAIRSLLISAEIAVLSARKRSTADQFYDRFSEEANDSGAVYKSFVRRLKLVLAIEAYFNSCGVVANRNWYQALFWGISVLAKEGKDVDAINAENAKNKLLEFYKSSSSLFENDGAAFLYQQFLERYESMSRVLSEMFDCSFRVYIQPRGRGGVDADCDSEAVDENLLRIERQEPITRSVDDISRLLLRKKFIIRPVYQREEVINQAKSSAIIESILLGIKLPPLFIFERLDGTQEVVDGQQRLLSILGYIGIVFRDENGNEMRSKKDGFALTQLRILEELKKTTFVDLEPSLQNKIWEFPLSLIIIQEQFNPNFEPVDLYIRLNNRPLPIKEHSFEMWNSYVPKELIDDVKKLCKKYDGWFYLTNPKNDVRMSNEELITTLAYMDYRWRLCVAHRFPSADFVDLFRRQSSVGVRIKQKSDITNLLNSATGDDDVVERFRSSIKNVEKYIRRLRTILLEMDDVDDPDNWLAAELSKILGRKTHSRKRQDHYSLWYVTHTLTQEIVLKHRGAIKRQVQELLSAMRSSNPDDDVNEAIAAFKAEVDDFRDEYAVDPRKLRLSSLQKHELIIAQGKLCPLCESDIYIHDDLAVDHIVPLATGGNDTLENVRVTHYFCNQKRGIGK